MNHDLSQTKETGRLIQVIGAIIEQARSQVRQTVNVAMIQAYWEIGRLIVEDEQAGQERASYGKQQLQQLSKQLSQEYGKGFDVRNLRNMRRFYLVFPIRDAVRTELSWTHYASFPRSCVGMHIELSRDCRMESHAGAWEPAREDKREGM